MRRLIPLLILLLAGCTTPIVKADVTRFHAMGPAVSPRSFTIVPEPDQAGSLEFQSYAEMVAAGLAAQGWRPVAPGGGEADAVVSIHWGVGQPNTVTWNTPSSVYGGYGWGSGGHRYGAGMGFPLGDPFPYWETRSATYFPKWLAVEIADARARKAGTRQVLFEGRAMSEGTRRELAPVMPYLVRALFTGFPGANGATVRVELPVDGG
jgi:hypothetical protein